MTDVTDVRREARSFARYLIGAEPTTDEEARYADATADRIAQHADVVVRAARAVPLLTGPLDAAAALLEPDHQLRQRLLLLTAILEASPHHADRFLPRAWSLPATVALFARLVTLIPLRLVVGVPAFVALRLVRG